MIDKIREILSEDDLEFIWEKIYKIYPNIRGFVDIEKLYEDILNILPSIDEGIRITEEDFGKMAEAIANCLIDILKVYENIYANNGAGNIYS